MKFPLPSKIYDLRSRRSQPAAVEKKAETPTRSQKSVQNQKVCAACLFPASSTDEQFCQTQCGHQYHEGCLQQWLKQKNTCCFCRQKLKKYMSKSKGEVLVPDREQQEMFRFTTFFSNDISSYMEMVLESSDEDLQYDRIRFFIRPRHQDLSSEMSSVPQYLGEFGPYPITYTSFGRQIMQSQGGVIRLPLLDSPNTPTETENIVSQQRQRPASRLQQRTNSRQSRRNKQKKHQNKRKTIRKNGMLTRSASARKQNKRQSR